MGPRTNLDVRRIAISGLAIAVAETAHEIGLNVSDVSLSVVGTHTQILVLNQEIRFPIYKWFKGVEFVDAGGTSASFSEIGSLRVGTGFGLRLAMPFALVRVDLAYPVDPRPEDKPRVYFSIGQAF